MPDPRFFALQSPQPRDGLEPAEGPRFPDLERSTARGVRQRRSSVLSREAVELLASMENVPSASCQTVATLPSVCRGGSGESEAVVAKEVKQAGKLRRQRGTRGEGIRNRIRGWSPRTPHVRFEEHRGSRGSGKKTTAKQRKGTLFSGGKLVIQAEQVHSGEAPKAHPSR